VPAILVSADQDVATEARALTAGAVDFIEKPLNAARVLSRVTAQLDMRRRATELRALLSGGRVSASLGFLMCHPDGTLTDIGADVAAALGLDRDAAAGTKLATLLATEGHAPLAAALTQGIAAGTIGPLEIALRGRDGETIPARLYGRIVAGAEGRRFWIKLDDLRDRVRLERDRLEHEKAAAIFSITAGIAHEFNNILGIVLGNIDSAIEEIEQPEKLAKRLRDAQAAAERGADISRAMLASAQREQAPAGEPLFIDALLTELWPILANSVPKRMTILREPSGRPLRCVVSADGLRGALIALLHNAADAHPGRGTITIRCFEEPPGAGKGPGMAAIEVSDDGPGMPPEVQQRAFDPFFTTRAPYRVGLGLTTVFSFAVRHNGSVDIRSGVGRGTSVTLHLPLAAAR
jgi:signal transduction histidine kinase